VAEPEAPDSSDDDGGFAEQVLLSLDGQLGPEGDAALRERLAADAGRRRLFVRLCLQTQALAEILGAHLHGATPDATEFEAVGAHLDEPPGSVGFARSIRRREWLGGPAVGRARAWLPWAITAAACILSLLATGAALKRRQPNGPARVAPTSVASQDREGAAAGSRHNTAGFEDVALVIKVERARWDPADGPLPARGDVLGARRLRLGRGHATLALFNGVTLSLQGPADVDLVSVDRVFCRQGKLRARVPEGAEGFIIASPASAVVDMGTEFAVNVDSDGRSRVAVFEGAAEAALLDAEGSPKITQIVERSQAFDLDPRTGRIAATDARPDGFVRAPEFATPSLVLDPSYPGAIRDSRPRGYWRFESLANGSVPNEVPGGLPLRLNGPIGVSGGPEGNGCAVFKPGEPEQFLFTDGLWELAKTPGHATELWFLSDGISHASLIGLFPPKDYLAPGKHGRFVHTFLLELTAHDRRSLFKPASVRFLHRWPLDTRIGNNIASEGLYLPRRWHHLVAQKNGDRLELFLDGELDGAMPLDPDHPTLACRLVLGRRTPDPLDPQDKRPFVGRLDEIAIYDHPLSLEEVRGHYRLAGTEESPNGLRNER
jgi:hypothetical protein